MIMNKNICIKYSQEWHCTLVIQQRFLRNKICYFYQQMLVWNEPKSIYYLIKNTNSVYAAIQNANEILANQKKFT